MRAKLCVISVIAFIQATTRYNGPATTNGGWASHQMAGVEDDDDDGGETAYDAAPSNGAAAAALAPQPTNDISPFLQGYGALPIGKGYTR